MSACGRIRARARATVAASTSVAARPVGDDAHGRLGQGEHAPVLLRSVRAAHGVGMGQAVGGQAGDAGAVEERRDPGLPGGEQVPRPQERARVVGRGERLVVPGGDRNGSVVSGQRGDDLRDGLRMQERQVGRRQEHRARTPADGVHPCGDALERAAAGHGILGHLDARRQRQRLPRSGHDHHRIAYPRQDRGDAVDERGAVPVEQGLRRPHAARRASGQDDCRGVRHRQFAETYWMIMRSVIHSIGALSSVSGLLEGPIGRSLRASAAAGSSGYGARRSR